MSEGTSQQADQPRRPRAAQGTRRTGSKQTKLLTPAALPAQEAAAPLAAPNTTGSPGPQALPAAEAPAQPAPDEPPVGEHSGGVAFERLEEYKAVLQNHAAIHARRQSVTNIFVSLNVVFLTAIGFLLLSSHLNSWWVVGAVAVINAAILPMNVIWYRILTRYQYNHAEYIRYLREIEEELAQRWGTPNRSGGIGIYRRVVDPVKFLRVGTSQLERMLAMYFLLLFFKYTDSSDNVLVYGGKRPMRRKRFHQAVPELTGPERAAIYGRVSTIKQRGRNEDEDSKLSLEDQEAGCRKLCQKNGYVVNESYVVREVSSGDTVHRPLLEEIHAAAKRGEIDLLVMYKVNRFARNEEKATYLYGRALYEHGIRIEFVEAPPSEKLARFHLKFKSILRRNTAMR